MKVGILGAGAIGCTIGGRLGLGGAEVRLVGRARIRDALSDGFTLSRWGEPDRAVPRGVMVTDDIGALAGCEVVLLTVKSGDTAHAAGQLAEVVPASVPIASLQNGVDGFDILQAALPGRTVWPGMVPFNIVWTNASTLHQGTSGPVVLPPAAKPLVKALVAGGCPARTHRDVRAVQWGKLLLNLNNAVNALAGIPLREQLSDAGFRRILAAVIDEGRDILKSSGIRVRGVGRLRPGLAPIMLKLPDWLFFRAAAAMISIDPKARSSMQDDLDRGRPTEVDHLNGTLVRLADVCGHPARLQRALVARVHQAEAEGGTPHLTAEQLLDVLHQPL